MPRNTSQKSSNPSSRVTRTLDTKSAGEAGAGKATKAHAKSTKKKADESHDEDSDGDAHDGDNKNSDKKGAIKLVWDEELTWALLSHIKENAKIKRGLYPPSGPNPSTANGGGKPKSDFHAELARALFEDHEKYSAQFSLDKSDPSRLSKWSGKIKNRINALEKKTRHFHDLMGETGQGITREEEIDLETKSELVNKWLSIKASFPFYFDVLELIGQRPNKIPAGVGNSLTGVDLNVIMGHSELKEPSLTAPDEVHSPSPPLSEVPISRKRSGSFRDISDSDDDDKEAADLLTSIQSQNPPSPDGTPQKTSRDLSPDVPDTVTKSSNLKATWKSKTKAKAKSEGTKKTGALSGSSTPASKGKSKSSSKKLKFGDQFVDAIAAEEETRQKALDVRLSQTELEKVKLEGKIAAKRDKLRFKAEMQKLAMEQGHQERMAKIHQRQWVTPALAAAGPSHQYQAQGDPLVLGDPSKTRSYAWFGNQENVWNGVPVVNAGPMFAGPSDPLADPLAMGGNANVGLGESMDDTNGHDVQW